MAKAKTTVKNEKSKDGFKLLAIRPLESKNDSFIRKLTPGTIYKLYKNIDFVTEGKAKINSVVSIKYKGGIVDDLYNTENGKLISISAIVGKNGSGKSSIVEALYAAIYNIAFLLGVIPKETDEGTKRQLESGVNIELYYRVKTINYKLTLKGKNLFIQHQNDHENKLTIERPVEKNYLEDFFYSIVINYSHHALNSRHIGDWVKNIFHKNDGYQTPIVLNPFRDEGNININNEEDLTYSRLLSNTLFIPEGRGRIDGRAYREIIDGRFVDQLKITINHEKLKLRDIEAGIVEIIDDNATKMLKIISKYYPLKNVNPTDKTDLELIYYTQKYILNKIFKISSRYKPFKDNVEYQYVERKYYSIPDKALTESDEDYQTRLKDIMSRTGDFYPDRFEKLIEKLSQKPSHYTFKLQQAINFINNYRQYRSKIGSFFPINDLARPLNAIAKRDKNEMIYLIPPSFFKVEIKFKDGGLFSGLSSGEKQEIFSSASYMYHLINLNSVVDDIIRYRYVNLVFDEIELYYHPDLQRSFINNFVRNIESLLIPNIQAINCIFITHSPFILSDIPNENVLFMEGGNSKTHEEQTFGANIHELLSDSFFLNKGYLGEFAKHKIQSIINKLSKNKLTHYTEIQRNNLLDEINLIGEPFLKEKLIEMYYTNSETELRIKELETELYNLKNNV